VEKLKGIVSIVKASTRIEGITNVLKLIHNEISQSINLKNGRILVKPNFVSVRVKLSATPLESVDTLLNYLTNNFNINEILIAESPSDGTLHEALENYQYKDLKRKYPLDFLYFDEDEMEQIEVYNSYGEKFKINIAKTALSNKYFKISICRPKTHDTVIVTLTIKNMAMGVIPRREKPLMHQGYYYINLNIARIAERVMPNLAIIDGLEGMQGNGPVDGEPINWGVFLASTNPVNLDALTTYMMGFNPKDVGYLYFLNNWGYGEINPQKIPYIGEDPNKLKVKFKPHSTYIDQLKWKMKIHQTNS